MSKNVRDMLRDIRISRSEEGDRAWIMIDGEIAQSVLAELSEQSESIEQTSTHRLHGYETFRSFLKEFLNCGNGVEMFIHLRKIGDQSPGIGVAFDYWDERIGECGV